MNNNLNAKNLSQKHKFLYAVFSIILFLVLTTYFLMRFDFITLFIGRDDIMLGYLISAIVSMIGIRKSKLCWLPLILSLVPIISGLLLIRLALL
jgi:hypothetical protein